MDRTGAEVVVFHDTGRWALMPFELAPVEPLPSVDLSKTLLSFVVTTETNLRVTDWIRRHYLVFAWFNRTGLLLVVVGIMLPRHLGKVLMVAGTPLSIIGVIPPIMLLNVPILRLLSRQYDFWVFSFFNVINWIVCAVIFGDLRAVSCIICGFNTQLVICIDANTRTIRTLVRGATLWFPGVILITITCSFHLMDVDEKHYEPLVFPGFDRHNLRITLVNLFANISFTISCYVGFRCYYKRSVLLQRFVSQRMIPSSIFRVGLTLKQCESKSLVIVRPGFIEEVTSTSNLARLPTDNSRSRFVVSISLSGWRSARVYTDSNTSSRPISLGSREYDGIQHMHLIIPRQTIFNSSETLMKQLNTAKPLSRLTWFSLKVCWIFGHLFSTYGLTLRPFASEASVVGMALTGVYVGTLLAHCNRIMLRALLRNFDTIYISLQCWLCLIAVGVSLEWRDWRMIALSTQLVWLHLSLVMDALLPDSRQRLGIRKRLFAPAMAGGVLFALFILVSIIMGSELILPQLENRVMFCLVNESHCVYALSFLLMRFISLLIATFRLLWNLSMRPEGELLFFRGRVEFWVPEHLMPFEITEPTKAAGRIHSIILPEPEPSRG